MVITGILCACDGRSGAAKKTVRVNSAASIAYVIEGLAEVIERDLNLNIEVNAGASGTLTQQIEQGDQADLFISADPRWVDRLEQKDLIDPATRTQLVGNRMVVVGLPDAVKRPATLEELSAKIYQPLAVGDPAYVPAGRYAMQALKSHGLERGPDLELAEAPNVRAALAFVRSGQCPAGLVYASDAHGEDGIDVLLTIDPADHDPIRYPVVLLRDAPNREQALRLLAWLKGETAQSAFRDAGFAKP
jgi:molybdate transport system substrate-binding protein